MVSMTVEYRSDGKAAIGRAGEHKVIADRPSGKAGGEGRGFNGGELLALAIGGCFCNDVQYTADEMGLDVEELRVIVTLDLDGSPLLATSAEMQVHCQLRNAGDLAELLRRAEERSTVANSVRAGFPVTIR
jgi:organic hydroperoxide reductase OsmC/OhrA